MERTNDGQENANPHSSYHDLYDGGHHVWHNVTNRPWPNRTLALRVAQSSSYRMALCLCAWSNSLPGSLSDGKSYNKALSGEGHRLNQAQ